MNMPNLDYNHPLVNEILSDPSLREKNVIVPMDEMYSKTPDYVFDRYISGKAPDSEPTAGVEIMKRVWESWVSPIGCES